MTMYFLTDQVDLILFINSCRGEMYTHCEIMNMVEFMKFMKEALLAKN